MYTLMQSLQLKLDEVGRGWVLQSNVTKVLGEMNPEQLWETHNEP